MSAVMEPLNNSYGSVTDITLPNDTTLIYIPFLKFTL